MTDAERIETLEAKCAMLSASLKRADKDTDRIEFLNEQAADRIAKLERALIAIRASTAVLSKAHNIADEALATWR